MVGFEHRPFYRNYPPGVLRLKDAKYRFGRFKKAKVFNSIKVPHRVQLIPPLPRRNYAL